MGVGKRLFRLEKMLKISGTAKHLQLLVWVDVSMAWSSNYYYFKIVSFGNLLFGVIYDINHNVYTINAPHVSPLKVVLWIFMYGGKGVPSSHPRVAVIPIDAPMDVGSPESDT